VRVTVFTSNQPRHLALVERVSEFASETFVVQEGSTVFPGAGGSPTMLDYFARVTHAEREVFGTARFGPVNVRQMLLKAGDLNLIDLDTLAPALNADAYVVFGAGYIKGDLADFLVEHRCFNIHMGTSPYYRGAATNFWALYDDRPEYVGATIHMLDRGLDSGPMLYHALPAVQAVDPFRLGMEAVRAAVDGFAASLASGAIWDYEPVVQDRALELRYARRAEFTDDVAAEYLGRVLPDREIAARLRDRDLSLFLRPHVAE
jgi:Formyl transferase